MDEDKVILLLTMFSAVLGLVGVSEGISGMAWLFAPLGFVLMSVFFL